MKASKTCAKILIALAFASVIGGLSTGPAFGEDRDRRHEQQRRGGHERDRRDRYRYDSRYRREYQPIYTPPPVVYAPSPSPGISIFFPLFR